MSSGIGFDLFYSDGSISETDCPNFMKFSPISHEELCIREIKTVSNKSNGRSQSRLEFEKIENQFVDLPHKDGHISLTVGPNLIKFSPIPFQKMYYRMVKTVLKKVERKYLMRRYI